MKTILLSTLAVALCGCNATTYVQTNKDGSTLSISNHRLLWSSDSYTASFNTNGASISANKSTSDSATIAAIVQGAVAGATKAVAP